MDEISVLREQLDACRAELLRTAQALVRAQAALEEIARVEADSHNVRAALGEARDIALRALEGK